VQVHDSRAIERSISISNLFYRSRMKALHKNMHCCLLRHVWSQVWGAKFWRAQQQPLRTCRHTA